MSRLRTTAIAITLATATALAALVVPATSFAQAAAASPAPSPADSLLAACVAAAERRDGGEAVRLAGEVERLLAPAAAARSGDAMPLVGLARARVQCRLPFGVGAEQGELFAESVELLERAVAAEPGNTVARVTLALVLGRAPKFLGRDAQADAQIDAVLAVLAERADVPEVATLLLTLGDLHARNGRPAEARQAWTKGRALFPRHTTLAERLGTALDSAAAPAAPASPAVLSTITVSAPSPLARASRTGRALTSLEVYTTPGGTADVLQALQLLPGVTGAGESSELALRGGDPAEAPVYVDGARLAYASKFESLNGGLFGVLDPAVLRSARVFPGGFSARWGDALSGVVVTETVGRPDGASTRLSVSSAGAGGTAMRPLGDAGGLWGTLRATEAGVLLRTHGRADEYPTIPYSVEAMGGWTRRVGTVEARVSALAETDASARVVSAGGHRGPYDARGTTALAMASLRGGGAGRPGQWWATASLSSRSGRTRFGALDQERALRRGGLRAESAWTLGDAVLLHAGAEGALLRETAGGTVPTTSRYGPDAPAAALEESAHDAVHAGGWLEAEWMPRASVTVTAGLRADRLPGERAWTGDPRLAVALTRGAWTGALSGGAFHQGRWRPRDDRPDRDAALGVARRARHLVASLEHAGSTTVRAEAYAKAYDAFVAAPVAAGRGTAAAAEGATVHGADVLVRPPAVGPVRWWATYSWLRARAELPDGRTVRTALDVTHALAAVGRLTLSPSWELGSTLRVATGRPLTPVVGAVTDGAGTRPVHGEPFADRRPTYARLDARLSRSARIGDGLLLGYVEALNVLDRRNVASYAWDETFRRREAVPYFFGRRSLVLGLEARF